VDDGLKPPWENNSKDFISITTRAKQIGGVAQDVEPCFASIKA
jgi:hypothetical protein